MSETNSRAGWQPATYYPDPAIHALDPRFEKYWLKLSAVERLATGLRWAEGPVWFGDGRYLLWSDIPNNRILKWEEETGAVSVFRKPSNFANGNTRDRQGRLITCEHGGRRVTRTEYDGIDHGPDRPLRRQAAQFAERRRGEIRRLDLVHRSALRHRSAITRATRPNPRSPTNVYRIDGETGKATIVAEGVLGPNGLCFSPDEKILYVVESRGVPNRKILAYDVVAGRRQDLQQARLHRRRAGHAGRHALRRRRQSVVRLGHGRRPNSTASWSSRPTAVMIGRIALPERCANLCFGGLKRNRLFMAASQSIYALYVNTQGALGG